MKIEAGKYYNTRDGSKVGPIVVKKGGWAFYPFTDWSGKEWDNFGRFVNGEDNVLDLIEECVEPQLGLAKLSGETIDMIALDSLKWHLQDGDMEPLQMEAFRIVLRYYGENK
jgi:hypothetical protein